MSEAESRTHKEWMEPVKVVCEHEEAMELFKIQRTKDWQLFVQLGFVSGFSSQRFVTDDIRQAS